MIIAFLFFSRKILYIYKKLFVIAFFAAILYRKLDSRLDSRNDLDAI